MRSMRVLIVQRYRYRRLVILLPTGAKCQHALMIPAGSIPAQDCFTRPHQTCRPTSFNRSCTENGALWSLLTMWAISGNNNFWTRKAKVQRHFRSRERKFQGTKVPWNKSSRERKFQETKVWPMELSLPRAKIRGNESSSYPSDSPMDMSLSRVYIHFGPFTTKDRSGCPVRSFFSSVFIHFSP